MLLGAGGGPRGEPAFDEGQADGLVRVAVEDRGKDPGRIDIHGELLPAFPREGLLRRFAGFDFPARKLPETGLGLALRPLREQHEVAVADYGADNVDDGIA